MSDTERVRAWRQRLKDGGLVSMTIWVKAETKARYEDLALQSHHSASEVAQLALDAYRLDPAMASAPVADTAQLRALIREELDEAMAILTATATAPPTDTAQIRSLIREELDEAMPLITAIVTETAQETLPALVETALHRCVADTVTETETATPQEPRLLTTVEAFVSDMATDTAGSALPQEPRAPSVSDTETDTVPETMAPTGAAPEAATEASPAPRGRRAARGPARRRTAPTPSD